MKKSFSWIFFLASLIVVVPSLRAQAVFTASERTRIQVGGGATYLLPDYTNQAIIGFSAWGDYDFSRWIGLEVTGHFGEFITPSDLSENSILIGPRLTYRKRKFTVYAKGMVGRATINTQRPTQSSSYNVIAYGGGAEYRLFRKINIRLIDFEQQNWPDFTPHTLSPTAISIGASYIIH